MVETKARIQHTIKSIRMRSYKCFHPRNILNMFYSLFYSILFYSLSTLETLECLRGYKNTDS